MVMHKHQSKRGSASLWKTGTSRNVFAVLSRVWAGRSSQAAPGADIMEEHKGLTPEQLKVLIALAKNA